MARDRVTAVATLLLGIFVIVSGLNMPRAALHRGPGPGDFPLLMGVLLLVLGVALLVNAGRKKASKAPVEVAEAQNEVVQSPDESGRPWIISVGGAVLLLVLYLLLLPLLGFVPATLIFSMAYLVLLYGQRFIQSLAPTVCFTVLCYVLFQIVLKVPLPTFLNR
ncbi:Tripartite tricarboxylate transporter TctB family protein [Desulfotomaculum arcticum]|uniref:Tripartite tricarboxylate transporter TctB family protein n=1 Tax=Desulfotruncus arcticus DSM 17038 TaxID=1121424 RepID=A0A1I2PHU9_9FIRM|nr:tripartite tricarboxylate transporter TctB family protein [Desulfotruncus arcticus]SFG14699.1 Tripartite tricarboxylate transporter TctB family protein [Desulfotomaculum arcticum] [Desulfotruncus arcticus DSM 17038]